MRSMGIDPSFNSTGVVILEDDNPIPIFATCLKSDTEASKIFRAVKMGQDCVAIAKEYKIDICFIESPALNFVRGNSNIRADLAGLYYRVAGDISILNGIPLKSVTPKSLKLFGSGTGKATKEQMVESVPEDALEYFASMNYRKTTGLQDLADAYFLALYWKKE